MSRNGPQTNPLIVSKNSATASIDVTSLSNVGYDVTQIIVRNVFWLYPMNTLKEPHSYCFCRSRLQRFLGRAFSGTSERALSGSSARVSAPHEVERMADDRGRVDAVDGMGLTHRGGLTEIADAEVADAVAPDPGEEGQGVRVTVEHGHQRGRMGGGEQLVGDGRTAARAHLRPLLDGPEDLRRRAQAHDARPHPEGLEPGRGLDDLGHDRSRADERDLVVCGRAGGQPVAAGDDLLTASGAQQTVGRNRGQLLLNRSRRQPE